MAFFAKRRHKLFLRLSRVSRFEIFNKYKYGILPSLKIILRALFWTFSIFCVASLERPGCHTGQAYSNMGRTKEMYTCSKCDWGQLNLFKSLRRESEEFACRRILFIWASHFKLEEIVTPRSLRDVTEVSGGIGARKRGGDLRKLTETIADLEGLTVMSREEASQAISWSMPIGLLNMFL